MELVLTATLLALLPAALQQSTPLPASLSVTRAWARSLDSGRTDPGVGETATAGQGAWALG